MLPAVICFVSVLCTTSLASFGMDAAAVAMSAQQEDIVRVSDGCLLFNELFAAVAILVCILYYAVVKVTLMAMGAVIMAPPDPHPLYNSEEDEEEEEAASPGTFSASSGEPDAGEEHSEIKPVFPPSDAMEDEPALERPAEAPRGGERFSSVKIWTNVYGLSVGIYCLVYSLLLPNELSAFVFCAVSLAAGVHESLTPCLELYLREDKYEMLGDSSRTKKRRRRAWLSSKAGCMRQAKRCLGWLCLFQSSVARELTEAASASLRRSRARAARMLGRQQQQTQAQPEARNKEDYESAATQGCLQQPRRSSLLGSGVMAMPCLILTLGAGLACKVLEAVLRRDALERDAQLLLPFGNATSSEDEDLPLPLFAGDTSRGVTAVNVLFPVVGVLMLKSMRKAHNVRETIEVSVPVCGVNSLCIVCVILMQGPACLLRHLAVEPVQEQQHDAVAALPVLNASGIVPLHDTALQPHARGGFVIARYQPILAALALPFPLVCAIVCIVASVRNHRVMVSPAALSHASKAAS